MVWVVVIAFLVVGNVDERNILLSGSIDETVSEAYEEEVERLAAGKSVMLMGKRSQKLGRKQ